MKNENTTIEAEVLAPAQAPQPRAVMVGPSQLRKQMARDKEMREIINEYIKNNMVEGKDFGRIEVKKGTGIMSKPSLFKPGGEKFCGLFKIRPTFKKDTDTVEMLGNKPGIIAYICELVDIRGEVIGEGRGTAKADPNGDDFNINKQVKIAQKRAQIDAVLRTGGLSDFFTQDMEDAPKQSKSPTKKATAAQIRTINEVVDRLIGKDDRLDEWINENLTDLNTLSVKNAGAIIGKLFDSEKKLKDGVNVSDVEYLPTMEDVENLDLSKLPY